MAKNINTFKFWGEKEIYYFTYKVFKRKAFFLTCSNINKRNGSQIRANQVLVHRLFINAVTDTDYFATGGLPNTKICKHAPNRLL
jgi:hypothetical protein